MGVMLSHCVVVPLGIPTPLEHRSPEWSARQLFPLSQWHTGFVLDYPLSTRIHRLSQLRVYSCSIWGKEQSCSGKLTRVETILGNLGFGKTSDSLPTWKTWVFSA